MADRLTGKAFATRSEVLGKNGMVASSQPLATQAGLDILKAGGNALDAAIAVNACLGLMEPTGCGIGGDVFAIVWDAKTQSLHGLNGSGRSAASGSLDDMKALLKQQGKEAIPFRGPLSISIPGCVDGWFTLHERFGKAPMSAVLAPAINYAESGFPVSELIAHYWERSIEKLGPEAGFLDTFTVDGKRAPAKGEIWKNEDLANVLKTLVTEGKSAFYSGEYAERMAAFLEEQGTFLRLEDFKSHQSTWVDPVSTNYRGIDIWELPPSGQGIAALQILNILEGYDLKEWGFDSSEYLHAFIEAKKLAYHDRANSYADPDFYDVPVERLISKEYANELRSRIDPDQATLKIPRDPEILRKGDTVYLSTADSEGNMVSFIQSNFGGMGSGLCPPGLGFGFQNRGSAFALDPGHANAYAPSKRPFHTIIPAFMTRSGQPICAFGIMGGDFQPQAHAQVVCNLVDFGMNLQEAGDAPRIAHGGDSEPTGFQMEDGGYISVESGFSPEVLDQLRQKGHAFKDEPGAFGGYQAIWRDPETGVYTGASESRKDGQAAGW